DRAKFSWRTNKGKIESFSYGNAHALSGSAAETISGEKTRPKNVQRTEWQRPERVLELSLHSEVKGGRSCARADGGDEHELGSAAFCRQCCKRERSVEVDLTKGFPRACLLHCGAERGEDVGAGKLR